ncbi:transcriptional regulator, TetR family [Psychroflexus torquis ATCC 700755]|uniref:Transcriptional regulator, TetR family n=1 Tax=Psychroflexus torquis (strain ATCC 700755 / CIP 106069 / ACAM 623) TaxID=313595 RepID=K4IJ28_PSYTT|nr:TetR/AcrR family transcriptional regulator [Psychroflexus torquis]AFU70364.1 transcriptional regulator, TetR family [Psychroflexus torquis ATCC 700755]
MTKASNTRHMILENAFDLIYKKGYQNTSIDQIIATVKVTKGAFYYHFKTKNEMGIAVIKEIIKPTIQNTFNLKLQKALKPIEEIYLIMRSLLLENPILKFEYGCPLGNLTQEMTPWNSEFTSALNEVTLDWQITIENTLKKEIKNGTISSDVEPKQVAYFILSSYWGIRSLSKVSNDNACYYHYLKELKTYLNNLK